MVERDVLIRELVYECSDVPRSAAVSQATRVLEALERLGYTIVLSDEVCPDCRRRYPSPDEPIVGYQFSVCCETCGMPIRGSGAADG